jgi:hypothetical protein
MLRLGLTAGAGAACVILSLVAPLRVVAQTTSASSPALPQGDDLTLADGAGNVLIGLTVRPAQPGPNTVLVHVLPLEGAAAAADVSVSLVINGQPVPLDFCARTCRTADVTLAGGEHVDVVADSASGGTAGFDLPALPTPDGNTLLQQMQDRMHRLCTFRSDELLRPAATPVETLYAFQAPDRMQMDISNGSHTIFVGGTRYMRDDRSGSAWQAEDAGIALRYRPSCGISEAQPQRSSPRTLSVQRTSMGPVRRCWRFSKTSDNTRSGSDCGRMPTAWFTGPRCADRATSWTSTTPTSTRHSPSSRRRERRSGQNSKGRSELGSYPRTPRRRCRGSRHLHPGHHDSTHAEADGSAGQHASQHHCGDVARSAWWIRGLDGRRHTLVGRPAPAFTLSDSEGVSFPISPGGGIRTVLIFNMGVT